EHTSELQSLTNLVCRLLLEKKTSALRSEEHTSELKSLTNLVCRLLLEKKKKTTGGKKHADTKVPGDVTQRRCMALPIAPSHGSAWVMIARAGCVFYIFFFFFFNDTATTEIYTLSLHDALPIWQVAEFDVAEFQSGGPRLGF